MARTKRTQTGSTTVEAIAVLSALSLIVTLGLSVAYLSFARVWIERNGYEALVCLSTSAPATQCERDFRRDIEAALPIGKISVLNSFKSSREGSLRVRFEIQGREVIRHSMSLRYPLTPTKLKERSRKALP